MSEQTSKTHTESAHLLRAIERGIVYDRLPAPASINLQPAYGSATLRFANSADVYEWKGMLGATVVAGQFVFDPDTTPWHEVGTRQGGKDGELVGWQVSIWASVDGLPPAPVPEHQLDAGWKDDGPGQCGVRCACGTTFDGFDSLGLAVRELHLHIAEPQPVDAPTTQAGE